MASLFFDQLKETICNPWRIEGFEYRDTGINKATKGVASVQVARVLNTNTKWQLSSHDTDILFTFIMQGEMELIADGQESQFLHEGDAYVIPPHLKYKVSNFSNNLELLEVSLPSNLII